MILLRGLCQQFLAVRDYEHIRISILPDFMRYRTKANCFPQTSSPYKLSFAPWILFIKSRDFVSDLFLIIPQNYVHSLRSPFIHFSCELMTSVLLLVQGLCQYPGMPVNLLL